MFRQPVSDVLMPAMVNTLILMLPATVIAVVLGIDIGAWLGWRRGGTVELGGNLLVLVLRSLPPFWIGVMLLMILSYTLGWFPIGGMRTAVFFPESWLEKLPGFDMLRHWCCRSRLRFIISALTRS